MWREPKQDPAHDGQVEPTPEHEAAAPQVLPQFAAANARQPSASDRAYGHGDGLRAGPAVGDKPADPERAKHIARSMNAGWTQLAYATPDERSTPQDVRLPANIVGQLDVLWQDSVSGTHDREQGGNLVRNSGGSYDIRRTANDSGHMFEPDENDVGWTQDLIGQVHTHPYREENERVPEQFATFSDGDFDALMRSDAHMSVLCSGPYTFILAKTKQFSAMVDALDNDETKLQTFAQGMTKVYDKAFQATEGKFSEKTEAGVMAVCHQFHLVYYSGQGSDLTRKTKRPPT
jgi:hypothetical protein